ncbi:MAG: tetratricopeptide repeat protein [Acidobacteria bacterium]|nr:tetratricopeptide repeat protein [Acidobacteriota bacterium]
MSETRNAYNNSVKRLFAGCAAVVVALLLAGSARGRQSGDRWLGDEERGRLEQLRDGGNRALYNLDFAAARACFSELARLFPQHPAGSQYLANTLLFETLYKMGRLHAPLYGTKSFHTQGDDKADPELANRFWSLTRDAQQVASARLKQHPDDAEALYYLGNVLALKATYEEAVEHKHTAALSDGCKAVELHRQVIKLDPKYPDAELTVGLYDYIVGSLPLPAKLVAGVFGARGSKKRGLAAVERVAKEGTGARDQARTLLVILYAREKRYGEAAEQARQLAADFPRNYLYQLEAADSLIEQATAGKAKHKPVDAGGAGEAFAIYEALLHDREADGTTAQVSDLIHFRYGEALLKSGRAELAAEEFLAAAKTEGAGEELATMAHLQAARALGASNRRDEATAQYRLVLSRPDVTGAHDEARKGLDDLTARRQTR